MTHKELRNRSLAICEAVRRLDDEGAARIIEDALRRARTEGIATGLAQSERYAEILGD
jgi:hypothetical protein